MHVSSQHDVCFWLPSNENLKKESIFVPFSKKHFQFKMNVSHDEILSLS